MPPQEGTGNDLSWPPDPFRAEMIAGPSTMPQIPTMSQTSTAPAGFSLQMLMNSPLTPMNNTALGPLALVDLIRRGHPAAPSENTHSAGRALDDEAADNEELYIVGTAVERDALVLHRLASGSNQALGTPNGSANIRTRAVSPSVSFVFYKSSPYDFESGRSEGVYQQVKGLMEDRVADDVLDRYVLVGHADQIPCDRR